MPNEMLTRRALLRASALTAAGATLAACGGPTPTPQVVVKKETVQVKETVPVSQTVVVQATTAPTAVPKKQNVKLALWNIWGGSRVPLMESMFKSFTAAHPWITVENVLVPGGQRLQKIQTAIAGGAPPDVAMINQSEIPMFASRRALLALDEYMAKDGVKASEYYDYAISQSQWKGKTYTLPIVSAAYHLYFYNNDHFAAAGLDPAKPPETWDELVAVAKKLTVANGKKLSRVGYQFYHGLPGFNDFMVAIYANNGKIISDDGRKVAFNSKEGLDALKFLVNLMQEVYGTADAYTEWSSVQGAQDITNPFIAGTASSGMRGVWEVFYIKEGKPDLNYSLALNPHSANAKALTPAHGAWSYGVPVGAKYPDDSWELVEWLGHEKTASCWFMQQQGRPSPLKSCNEDKWYHDTFPKTWPTILKMVAQSANIPITPASGQMEAKMAPHLEAVAFGKATPEQALETFAKEYQTLLDTSWKEAW